MDNKDLLRKLVPCEGSCVRGPRYQHLLNCPLLPNTFYIAGGSGGNVGVDGASERG